MAQTKTKENIEYEKALKNLHELSLRKALSEDGIDTSKIPRKKFDDLKRLVDSQSPVKQKYQEIITRAQQDANAIITKAQQEAQAIMTRAQQDMQAELKGVHDQTEEIVKQIKVEQGIIQEEKQPEAEAQPEGAGIEAGKEAEK